MIIIFLLFNCFYLSVIIEIELGKTKAEKDELEFAAIVDRLNSRYHIEFLI